MNTVASMSSSGGIDAWYFLTSLCLGLLYVYLSTPAPEVIVKFPSPYNAGKLIYSDSAHTCFKYRADKVTCPADKALIKPQPIMEDFRTIKQSL